MSETPAAACPVCGAFSGSTLAQAPALLAVCDVLVVRALESVGRRIVMAGSTGRGRNTRGSRLKLMNGRSFIEAHTIWRPEADMIDKGLLYSWDVIPAMLDSHGCCGVTSQQVTSMVDKYVRDLLVTGTAHSLTDLRYRFEAYLGIPLEEPAPYDPAKAG